MLPCFGGRAHLPCGGLRFPRTDRASRAGLAAGPTRMAPSSRPGAPQDERRASSLPSARSDGRRPGTASPVLFEGTDGERVGRQASGYLPGTNVGGKGRRRLSRPGRGRASGSSGRHGGGCRRPGGRGLPWRRSRRSLPRTASGPPSGWGRDRGADASSRWAAAVDGDGRDGAALPRRPSGTCNMMQAAGARAMPAPRRRPPAPVPSARRLDLVPLGSPRRFLCRVADAPGGALVLPFLLIAGLRLLFPPQPSQTVRTAS